MSWFTDHAAFRTRRTQRWLQHAGTDMAAMLDSASDALWALDARKRFVFGNRMFLSSFRDAFGLVIEPGAQIRELLAPRFPEYSQKWNALYDRALAGEQIDEEQTYRLRDGDHVFLVSIVPIWRRGAIVGVSALAKDITALKQTERSLRAAEERFERVFHVSPAPIVITSPGNGRIIDANEAFAKMFGYRREEILGRTTLELKMWLSAEERGKLVEELKRTGSVWGVEFEFRARGGERVVALGGFVLTTIGGEQCMVGVAEEITERKKWEEHARRAERIEAIGELASGVAHEFNNLLMVIEGGSELLRKDGVSKEKQARILEKIHESARKAAHLTRQLLAFGRRQPLKPSEVHLNALVTELADLLKKTLGEQIRLQLALGRDLPPLWIDRMQLEQALLNLAFNARDAMPLGGTLAFRTLLTEAPEDRPRDVPPGPLIALEVSDTGIGMDRETLSRLFEPFFTTHEPGEGSGMGLSMVHGIVRQSHGYIRVESEQGRGTTFRLYFPPAEGVLPAEAIPREEHAPAS